MLGVEQRLEQTGFKGAGLLRPESLRGTDLKALTLHQPWASLIVEGRKTIETRGWGTSHRGLLAIHAGLTVDREFCAENGMDCERFARGAVLGLVELVKCVSMTDRWIETSVPIEQLKWGNFADGRVAWMLQLVERFEVPIPAKGMRLLWEWKR